MQKISNDVDLRVSLFVVGMAKPTNIGIKKSLNPKFVSLFTNNYFATYQILYFSIKLEE